MDGEEVVIFCYPVKTGFAQQIAVQDEVYSGRVWCTGSVSHNLFGLAIAILIITLITIKIPQLLRSPNKPNGATWCEVLALIARSTSSSFQKLLLEAIGVISNENLNELHERLYPSVVFLQQTKLLMKFAVYLHEDSLGTYPSFTVRALNGKRLSDVLNAVNIRRVSKAVQEVKDPSKN